MSCFLTPDFWTTKNCPYFCKSPAGREKWGMNMGQSFWTHASLPDRGNPCSQRLLLFSVLLADDPTVMQEKVPLSAWWSMILAE